MKAPMMSMAPRRHSANPRSARGLKKADFEDVFFFILGLGYLRMGCGVAFSECGGIRSVGGIVL